MNVAQASRLPQATPSTPFEPPPLPPIPRGDPESPPWQGGVGGDACATSLQIT